MPSHRHTRPRPKEKNPRIFVTNKKLKYITKWLKKKEGKRKDVHHEGEDSPINYGITEHEYKVKALKGGIQIL